MDAEERRLRDCGQRTAHWRRWGPFLSERGWGTVREDYSVGGNAWEHLSHDDARSKAYRWNEDGIGGICDRHQELCFAVSLWNGRDPILKERLFGLTGTEGNHGEDCKELYFYLDSTPTHSYLRFLYKYPQGEFPYARLVDENRRRGRTDTEFELLDSGVLDADGYWDIDIEYGKHTPEQIAIRITVSNRGSNRAELVVLPTVWFRNTWSWGHAATKPRLRRSHVGIELDTTLYGRRWLLLDERPALLLFTENETNNERLYGVPNPQPFVKDGIDAYVVGGRHDAVNPAGEGTKAAAAYHLSIPGGTSEVLRLLLTDRLLGDDTPAADGDAVPAHSGRSGIDMVDDVISLRRAEADEFYAAVTPSHLSPDGANVMRQAFAGLLWSKQYYHYVVRDWLSGDPAGPPPPDARRRGRNAEWTHLHNADVVSVPDKWEYPWYAAWDLAFHCVPIALIDPDFAKDQLTLMLREWYMHPNGQLPAYEWALGDVNPPVHAWAVWRVYKIEERRRGRGDVTFLERAFHKLLLNFTWWVNRKDAAGRNVFQGGFLGLDNIGVFDRSAPLPTGGFIEQADGTGWMAMYSLNLLAIALELARYDPAYEDVASKFWEHFLYIAKAVNHLGDGETSLWDEDDGFFYDVLHRPGGVQEPMRVRSMVGLIPLFAVETIERSALDALPGFKRRMDWFIENRTDLVGHVASMSAGGKGDRRLMAMVGPDQLRRILAVMLDEREFLSPYGIRSVSRRHAAEPFVLDVEGVQHRVAYEPGESQDALFGGNSNWRGPIWFPVNYLLIESLQKFHHYYGDGFVVECPTGSGTWRTLWEVATELSRRLSRLFLRDERGYRPAHGPEPRFATDPHWRDLVLFHEYFHGGDGTGLGASHQTGWTGLVAKLLQQSGE